MCHFGTRVGLALERLVHRWCAVILPAVRDWLWIGRNNTYKLYPWVRDGISRVSSHSLAYFQEV